MNVEGTKHAAEVHAEQRWVLQVHVTYRCLAGYALNSGCWLLL